jgi:phosphopantetheinyl transferase (holo-ACP synthase)
MSESFQRIYLSDSTSSVAIESKKQISTYAQVALFPEEKEQLCALKNEFRKIEFLGIRSLRNKLSILEPINYTVNRKPYLDGNQHMFISISHSKKYCALGASLSHIGIDMEEVSPRIERISERFVHQDEVKFIGTDHLLDLTKLWTMKEAMFKLNDRSGIEFKTELIIEEQTGDIYFGKMLTEKNWRKVKLECFQLNELVISVGSFT